VVLAVVVAPVLVVWVASFFDRSEGDRMRGDVETGARRTAELLAAASPGSALDDAVDAIVHEHELRIRVVDTEGRVVVDRDHGPALSLRNRIGDLFFGPDGAPTLREWDDALPPVGERAAVQRALAGSGSTGCEPELGGRLLVCESAIGVGTGAVLAQKGSPRAIRAFYDARYPMLKLTLYVLVVGLGLAAWLGRRIVRPIETLREEVLVRTATPGTLGPIPARPGDEIGDLAEAFNALLRAVDERGRANEAFAEDLVHELKSPVAALRAAAEAMSAGSIDEARAKRLARVIDSSSQRLDALVTRFLELARAEAGLSGEERTIFDVAPLVRGLVEAMRDDERHAKVRFEALAAPAEIEGVMPRIEAAIRNVLDNAASFASDGGWVRAIVKLDGNTCVIEVSDSGPGIPEDRLPKVFDRFFTERRTGQGTGLGLALTRAIVEAHGGAVSAASPQGSGAIFTLRLPLVSHGVHTRLTTESPAS
jgi:two-component system sensor histidine kinase ChvG